MKYINVNWLLLKVVGSQVCFVIAFQCEVNVFRNHINMSQRILYFCFQHKIQWLVATLRCNWQKNTMLLLIRVNGLTRHDGMPSENLVYWISTTIWPSVLSMHEMNMRNSHSVKMFTLLPLIDIILFTQAYDVCVEVSFPTNHNVLHFVFIKCWTAGNYKIGQSIFKTTI